MNKFRVMFVTTASTMVEVEVPEEMTDHQDIANAAAEQGNFPTLCHQCAAGGRHGQSLDLGDWDEAGEDGELVIERVGGAA